MAFLANLEEIYKIIKEIEKDSNVSQRDLARRLGYSLGKINYLLKALAEKGIIKFERFKKSPNKWAYRYLLTPKGIREKYKITKRFLQIKLDEYERLKREIEELEREVGEGGRGF
ncbi:MAG: hypothetical protein PWR24_1802 [Desulfonauticus sp.]|jgi:EPS-associated MarR family transcriptional regulator|nr:hypothetical protein [Desulfonauticus sp.]